MTASLRSATVTGLPEAGSTQRLRNPFFSRTTTMAAEADEGGGAALGGAGSAEGAAAAQAMIIASSSREREGFRSDIRWVSTLATALEGVLYHVRAPPSADARAGAAIPLTRGPKGGKRGA